MLYFIAKGELRDLVGCCDRIWIDWLGYFDADGRVSDFGFSLLLSRLLLLLTAVRSSYFVETPARLRFYITEISPLLFLVLGRPSCNVLKPRLFYNSQLTPEFDYLGLLLHLLPPSNLSTSRLSMIELLFRIEPYMAERK